MFIVLLRFSTNRDKVSAFMDAHRDWITRGFEDGVFLLAGTLQPGVGGGILAGNTSLADLQERVNDDPFVAADVVSAEILEMAPSRAAEQFQFLIA
jgi:uncharacterized protein YciI